MAKQIEDIIPNDRRSIRDIPIPEGRKKSINLINEEMSESVSSYVPPRGETTQPIVQDVYVPGKSIEEKQNPIESSEVVTSRIEEPDHRDFSPIKKPKKFPRKPVLVALGVLLIMVGLGIFSLFNGAAISYKPKTLNLSFNNETFQALKDGKPGDLLFSVIKISGEKTIEAPASGEVQTSDRASGQIIVYNNSGSASQHLIKNTRFQTSDGKIYRVQNDITIPGKKGDQPGSLEITVYADQPGESYNIGLSDFTLPGLKGDPKFTTIYARSKTPMTGGFVGTKKKVSDADKKSAQSSIEDQLKESLLEEAKAQVPEDFVLIPSLTEITYEDLPEGTSTADKALVREKGNFSGIIFKKSDLLHYLAAKKTTLGVNESVDSNLESLTITPQGGTISNLSGVDKINLYISGNTQIMWVVNEEDIKNQVAGKNKNALQSILANYPSIIEASGVVRPFWKQSFPMDPGSIRMVNDLK